MNKSLLLIACTVLLCSVVSSTPILKENSTETKDLLIHAKKSDPIEIPVKLKTILSKKESGEVKPAKEIVLEEIKPIKRKSDEDKETTIKQDSELESLPKSKKEDQKVEEDKQSKKETEKLEEVKPVKKESKEESESGKKVREDKDETKPVKKEDKEAKLENPIKKESKQEDESKPIKKESKQEDESEPIKKETKQEDESEPIKKESKQEDESEPIKKEAKQEDESEPIKKESKQEDVDQNDDADVEKKEVKEDETEPIKNKAEEKQVKPVKKSDDEDEVDDDEDDKRSNDISVQKSEEQDIKKNQDRSVEEESDKKEKSSVKRSEEKVESSDKESSSQRKARGDGKTKEEKREENLDDEKEEKVEKRSISEEKPELTPCEESIDFKYYQPHPTDPTKYYVCDPWGSGNLNSCLDGQQWNSWLLTCDKPENIKNLTQSIPLLQSNVPKTIINCSATEFSCQNEGVCTETDGFYKCVCGKDYTGEFCESRIDITDITHDILDGKFSIDEYKSRLVAENISMEIDYYRRYKDQLDNATYGELMKYLSMYKTGEIRYDTLINRLIEDILHDIYPDAEYLSTFNASSQYVVSMIRLMPSLLSYSRYSLQRYDRVFAQYQKVLGNLILNLNNTVPTIANEATEYVILTEVFLNQTISSLDLNVTQPRTLMTENSSKKNIQLSEKDIIVDLKANFNATLRATELLFEKINKFQEKVIPLMETDPKFYTVTLGECKIEGATELVELFNEIASSSAQIWDSLVNYGFWYITNSFTTTAKHQDANKYQLALH